MPPVGLSSINTGSMIVMYRCHSVTPKQVLQTHQGCLTADNASCAGITADNASCAGIKSFSCFV